MTTETVLESLKQMDFVEGLSDAHLEKLASMTRPVEFPANITIFREGEMTDTVYLIVDGQVAIEIHVPSRGRVTILTLGRRQILGWSPMFENKPNTASGRTLTAVKALEIDAKWLRNVCQVDHELGCAIGWRVAETISSRLKATRLQLLDIFAPAP